MSEEVRYHSQFITPSATATMSTSSSENKRARVGLSKSSSFTDDLNSQTLSTAVTLLRNLDEVDFGNFVENQL